MLPHIHFIAGLALSFILYPFYGPIVIILLLSSFLIDVDHYLLYIARKKSFNIEKAFNYFRFFFQNSKNKGKLNLCIFHTLEFLILTMILSFYSTSFLMIFYGILLHYALDLIHAVRTTKEQGFELSIIQLIFRQIP